MRSVFCCFLAFTAVFAAIETPQKHKSPKFVVYPGLDVSNAAVATWLNGYSSPWNVFFGNQPYVVGWVGQEESDYEDYSDYKEEELSDSVPSPAVDAPYDQVTEERRKKIITPLV